MLKRLRSRLTYANVASSLALLLALSTGTAYAANTVFSSDIVDGEVKTPDLANLGVTVGKLANGAVTTQKLANLAVTNGKLALNSVGSGRVIDETLTAADLGPQFCDRERANGRRGDRAQDPGRGGGQHRHRRRI